MQTPSFVERVRKSAFIHEFTKTPPGVVCPHFFVLAHANGCPYSCDYCYLQLTLRYVKEPTVFSNRADLLRDVRKFLEREKPSVLTAGELSDALAFDHATNLTRDLGPLFAAQDRHKLLLLTKSTNVGNLLALDDHRNTIASFTLNASEVSARFERGAPPPFERIAAAAKCQAAGYDVRLRIDPVLPIDGWKQHYEQLIEEIKRQLDITGMRFTLGSIRYFRSLPHLAKRRGRDATVFEFASSCEGDDKRMRMAPERRVEIYEWFREKIPAAASVALCKETKELWQKLGWDHKNPKCNCAV